MCIRDRYTVAYYYFIMLTNKKNIINSELYRLLWSRQSQETSSNKLAQTLCKTYALNPKIDFYKYCIRFYSYLLEVIENCYKQQ